MASSRFVFHKTMEYITWVILLELMMFAYCYCSRLEYLTCAWRLLSIITFHIFGSGKGYGASCGCAFTTSADASTMYFFAFHFHLNKALPPPQQLV